jgi:hypothetical protein
VATRPEKIAKSFGKVVGFTRFGTGGAEVQILSPRPLHASIGFTETARYEDDGLVNFGMVSVGEAEVILNMH